MAILQLVAIWAGVSRRSCFVRTLAICLVLATMLPIRALEPIVWHALALPLTAVCSRWLWRRFGDQPPGERDEPGVRFSLQSFFLFVLLAGGLSAVVARLWHDGGVPQWENAVLVACGAVISQLCLLTVLRRWWRLLPLAAILLLASGIGALAAWVLGVSERLQLTNMFPDMFPSTYHVLGLCSAAYAVMAAVILVVLMFATMGQSEQRRVANTGRIGLLAVAVVVLIPMSTLYFQMLQGPPLPTDHRAAPNNYNEISKLVQEAVRLNPSELDLFSMRRGPSPTTSRELEQHYDDLFAVLQTPGYVPLDLRRDTTHQYMMKVVGEETGQFRSVCRMFDAESQSATVNGRFGDAVNYSLANVQMGNTVSRGGIAIQMLNGIAIEGFGTYRLWKIHADLTPDELRKLVKDLERIRAAREGYELTAAREFAFTDRTYNWMHRLLRVVSRFIGYDHAAPVMSVSRTAYDRRTAEMSLLLAELAVAAYRKEHGEAPDTFDQLVPDYLATVPPDPWSGKPVILRKTADGVVVYSVGPDGKDDGGRFGGYRNVLTNPGFDYDLGVADR